jgi:hypothetical protein
MSFYKPVAIKFRLCEITCVEHRISLIENWILRRIFEPKIEEVAGN